MSTLNYFGRSESNILEILSLDAPSVGDVKNIDLRGNINLQNELYPTHIDWIKKITGLDVAFYQLPRNISDSRFLYAYNNTMYIGKKRTEIYNDKMDADKIYIFCSSAFLTRGMIMEITVNICKSLGVDIKWILKYIIPNGVFDFGNESKIRNNLYYGFTMQSRKSVKHEFSSSIVEENIALREQILPCQLCGNESKLEVNAVSSTRGLIFIPMCPRCKSYLLHGLRSTIATKTTLSMDIGMYDSRGIIDDDSIVLPYTKSIVQATKHFVSTMGATGSIYTK